MTTPEVTTQITDEALAALRGRIGVRIVGGEEGGEVRRTRILRSLIRSWAVVTGDMRPLFVDLEYAQKSRWGTLLAPPGVLINEEQLDPEVQCLPGAKAILDTAQLEWRRPLRLGDALAAETVITDVEEAPRSGDRGRVATLKTETEVREAEGAVVGTVRLQWTCVERGSGAQRALFGGRPEPHVYSREDIEALGAEYKLEQARGAELLAWEAVSVGDELPCVLKGPTTRNRYTGASRWYQGHLQGFEAWKRNPELFFMNENQSPEPIYAIDANHHRAQRWGGMPGALEANTERVPWLTHLLLNWCGDHGFVSRLDLRFPVQNMVGDVTRGYGRVTGKRNEDGRGLVDLDVWQENQLGHRITEGVAEVVLPLAADT